MPTNVVLNLRWRDIRDQIVAELEDVVSGRVHGFLRFDNHSNEERFRKKFIPSGSSKINAWTVTRAEQSREYLTNREIESFTAVVLDFWYQLDDEAASQDTFDDIVDDVIFHFQEPIRLSGEVELQGPIQLTISDHRYFAGKLVHHCELQTVARHRVFQNTFR